MKRRETLLQTKIIMIWKLLCLLLLLVQKSQSGLVRKPDTDHVWLRAIPETDQHLEVIHNQASNLCQAIKETKILGRAVDFFCRSSKSALALEKLLLQHGVESRQVLATDLQSEQKLNANLDRIQNDQPLDDAISFDKYARYEDIMAYLENLERNPDYSGFFSVDWAAGERTHEGRKLPIVKIGNSKLGDETRAVWIDAGIHAREWIASATATYVIDKLIRAFADSGNRLDPQNEDLLSVDWYIVPLLNPDGYEYSHVSDRMWRKNRSPPPPGSNCFGIDLNRNYDVIGFGVGASDNPCDETYKGTPNSEPEVQRATKFLLAHRNNIRVSLSLHSFGQLILTSWGYKADLPYDNDKLMHFGNKLKQKIEETSGRLYTVGSAGAIFYAAGGASDDYAKAGAKIPFAATIELPDGSAGSYGFQLPASNIRSVGEEIFRALSSVARDAANEPLGPDQAYRHDQH